jgi:hypothetical protein
MTPQLDCCHYKLIFNERNSVHRILKGSCFNMLVFAINMLKGDYHEIFGPYQLNIRYHRPWLKGSNGYGHAADFAEIFALKV